MVSAVATWSVRSRSAAIAGSTRSGPRSTARPPGGARRAGGPSRWPCSSRRSSPAAGPAVFPPAGWRRSARPRAGDRALGDRAGQDEVRVAPGRCGLAGVEVLIGGHRAFQRLTHEQVAGAQGAAAQPHTSPTAGRRSMVASSARKPVRTAAWMSWWSSANRAAHFRVIANSAGSAIPIQATVQASPSSRERVTRCPQTRSTADIGSCRPAAGRAARPGAPGGRAGRGNARRPRAGCGPVTSHSNAVPHGVQRQGITPERNAMRIGDASP